MTSRQRKVHTIPHVDARDKDQRELAAYLRQQHLPGVDIDDDASVTLEIEQARLALFASGAAMAFEVTQLLASRRLICITPLYWSLVFLLVAFAGAWIALVASEYLRRFRVDRRYTIYHGELAGYLALQRDDSVDHASADRLLRRLLSQEDRRRCWLRTFRYLVALVTAGGIGIGVLSAIGTADPQRCNFELLRPQPDPR